MVDIIPVICLMLILLLAVVSDLRSRKIPNRLTFPAVLAGILYHAGVGGWRGLLFSLEGMLLGLALLGVFYLLGGMGAGDVKLMAAVGSFLGPKDIFVAFIGTALVGGIYAIILVALNRRWTLDAFKQKASRLRIFLLSGGMVSKTPRGKEGKPALSYGVAIALGTLLALIKRAV